MNYFRVSKYCPVNRINGTYTINEWTDYSDIGHEFEGHMLTKEMYEIVEANYLLFFKILVQKCQVDRFQISGLEIYDESVPWIDRTFVSPQDSTVFLQDCLRNRCWGYLVHSSLKLSPGWDYYLHIACILSYDCMCTISSKLNLFTENWNEEDF